METCATVTRKDYAQLLTNCINWNKLVSRFIFDQFQEINVETLDKGGFRIKVHSERNHPGLLVSILEAFEELGLDVSDARVSCTDSFHLEAVGGEVSFPIYLQRNPGYGARCALF